MKNLIKKFNDIIGDKLAYGLSTMAMFYGICFLVVAPLFFQTPTGLVPWMQYIVSVFFQGVALPVLGYVARKGSEKQEQLLNETHDTVMKEMESLREITNTLKDIIKDQHDMANAERASLKNIVNEIHEHLLNKEVTKKHTKKKE